MSEPKLYADRDPTALGDHYIRHISAMTAEDLHSKSDIAAELAWRDAEIERLTALVERAKPLIRDGEQNAKDALVAIARAEKAERMLAEAEEALLESQNERDRLAETYEPVNGPRKFA